MRVESTLQRAGLAKQRGRVRTIRAATLERAKKTLKAARGGELRGAIGTVHE